MGRVGVVATLATLCGPLVASAASPDPPRLYLPFSYPPDGSGMMGEAYAGTRAPIPGVTAPLVPPIAKTPQAAPADPSRAQMLDGLFRSLATTQDAGEAKAVASRIGFVWLRSGSETADLLMSRAAEAYGKGSTPVALQLLDRLVILEPGWAEAWEKRAVLRVIADDQRGAMEDIAHVLSLEPRHFAALGTMAMLLSQQGMNREALTLFRRAAALYPANVDLRQMIDKLNPLVEGRPI